MLIKKLLFCASQWISRFTRFQWKVMLQLLFFQALRTVNFMGEEGGGRHGTEVELALLTQQHRVCISTLPKFFRWSFKHSAMRSPIGCDQGIQTQEKNCLLHYNVSFQKAKYQNNTLTPTRVPINGSWVRALELPKDKTTSSTWRKKMFKTSRLG